MRRLKILWVGLVAMLAMSAIAVATASADTFEAESYPVTLTGDQDGGTDVFTTTAGTVSCKKVSYHGIVEKAVNEVSATPTYSECTAFGLVGEVHTNGCSYLFRLTTAGAAATTSTVDIVCPPGKEITVTGGSPTVRCIVHVPPQTGLAHVNWTNVGSPNPTRELTGHVSITGIKYTHTKGTGLGACTAGSATNGSYSGRAGVTGENGSGHIGIFLK